MEHLMEYESMLPTEKENPINMEALKEYAKAIATICNGEYGITFYNEKEHKIFIILGDANPFEPDDLVWFMRDAIKKNWRIKEEDIPTLIGMFRKEIDNSLIVNRILLDTSNATVEETFEQFKRDVTQYLTEKDMLRIILHYIRTGERL